MSKDSAVIYVNLASSTWKRRMTEAVLLVSATVTLLFVHQTPPTLKRQFNLNSNEVTDRKYSYDAQKI